MAQVESFLESLRFPVEPNVAQPLTLDQKMKRMTDEQALTVAHKEVDPYASTIDLHIIYVLY